MIALRGGSVSRRSGAASSALALAAAAGENFGNPLFNFAEVSGEVERERSGAGAGAIVFGSGLKPAGVDSAPNNHEALLVRRSVRVIQFLAVEIEVQHTAKNGVRLLYRRTSARES